MGRVVALGVVAILGVGSVIAAQAPQFRSGVDLVTLDVTVLDRAGRPVIDLRQDEFIVLENGKLQTIGSFASVHSPVAPTVTAEWAKSAPVDVAVNNINEQRLLVLVIDDATLPFDPAMVRTAKSAARMFVEKVGPTDRVPGRRSAAQEGHRLAECRCSSGYGCALGSNAERSWRPDDGQRRSRARHYDRDASRHRSRSKGQRRDIWHKPVWPWRHRQLQFRPFEVASATWSRVQ